MHQGPGVDINAMLDKNFKFQGRDNEAKYRKLQGVNENDI